MHFVKSSLLAHKTLSGWGYGEFQGRRIFKFVHKKMSSTYSMFEHLLWLINNDFNQQTLLKSVLLFFSKYFCLFAGVHYGGPQSGGQTRLQLEPLPGRRHLWGPRWDLYLLLYREQVWWSGPAHLISGIKYLISNHVYIYNQYNSY